MVDDKESNIVASFMDPVALTTKPLGKVDPPEVSKPANSEQTEIDATKEYKEVMIPEKEQQADPPPKKQEETVLDPSNEEKEIIVPEREPTDLDPTPLGHEAESSPKILEETELDSSNQDKEVTIPERTDQTELEPTRLNKETLHKEPQKKQSH
jgi:hypothetical protein